MWSPYNAILRQSHFNRFLIKRKPTGNGTCGLLSFIAARGGKSLTARLKTRGKGVSLHVVVDDEVDVFVEGEIFKG